MSQLQIRRGARAIAAAALWLTTACSMPLLQRLVPNRPALIVGRVTDRVNGLGAIPILINGVDNGIRTSPDGRFRIETKARLVALTVPGTNDTLRLPALHLGARDSVQMNLILASSPKQAGPAQVSVTRDQGMIHATTSGFPSRGLFWVVDGKVVSSETAEPPDLSQARVARIDMIVGAEAASRYGSRAAGGVVSVTTRPR